MTALITNHIFDAVGEQINDFSFSFIAPLRAENNNTFTHNFPPFLS